MKIGRYTDKSNHHNLSIDTAGVTPRVPVNSPQFDSVLVKMSHKWDDPNLKGFKRMFNSETGRGRSNYAKLMLSLYASLYIAYRLTRSPAQPAPELDTNTTEDVR
uniref:Uncharacterized protein n=1 Tax=Graphocephala atropunctata TaxID=36148 RepID=A0A1B6M644_9HEMI